jgi:hypothetical protein
MGLNFDNFIPKHGVNLPDDNLPYPTTPQKYPQDTPYPTQLPTIPQQSKPKPRLKIASYHPEMRKWVAWDALGGGKIADDDIFETRYEIFRKMYDDGFHLITVNSHEQYFFE